MSLGASPHTPLRPGDRRRNQRRKTSALIYAQIGTGTGGIVIDLGMDGVACHVVRELFTEPNSILDVRLRGSGLSLELSGELIWTGPTRKDIGLRFQNPSAEALAQIESWLARETRPFESRDAEVQPKTKPTAAVPVPPATGGRSFSTSLSAALARSRSTPQIPAQAEEVASTQPISAPAPDAPAEKSMPPARPEIASPIEKRAVPAAEVTHVQPTRAISAFEPAVKKSQTTPSPDHSMRTAAAANANSHPIPAPVATPRSVPANPIQRKIRRIKGSTLVPKSQVSRTVAQLIETIRAGKWVPEGIVTTWTQSNRQRKMLLAGSAAVCVLAFVFLLSLAVSSIGGSSGTADQQASAAARARLHHTSVFGDFLDNLFGRQQPSGLDASQVGVQVWTSQRTGFYYCTDTPYYKDVQPGAFMSQGEALQSGYRPIVGQFCD